MNRVVRHSDAVVDVNPSDLALEIVRLMQGFSVEITPAEIVRPRVHPPNLPPDCRVYVPWIAGSRFEDNLRAAVRVRDMGLVPVPHLAARAIGGTGELDRMLSALATEAGVDHAMLIAGSQHEPFGDLTDAMSALSSGLFERHGWNSLGLASHPEGSPGISEQALKASLRAKNAYADQSAMCLHLVTQFCFSGASVVDWERKSRADGNRLPVHIGLAGLASLTTLIKYARNCGVGPSIGALTRQGSGLLKLATGVKPGEVVVAAARARLADPNSRFERCHFFPFGSLDATLAWGLAVARGDFKLNPDNTDIVL